MINLYDKLVLHMLANPKEIERAIQQAAQKQSMSINELKKTREILLNPETRKRYNDALREKYPEAYQHAIAIM